MLRPFPSAVRDVDARFAEWPPLARMGECGWARSGCDDSVRLAFALVGDMDAYKKTYGDAWETVSLFRRARGRDVLIALCVGVQI